MVGNFIEVDFPTVTARKCQLIKKSRVLLDKIVAQDEDGVDVRLSRTDLHGRDYHVIGADFTNVAALEKKLAECNVDYGRPTIFIAECVLVYVGAKETANFLRWCVDKFTHSPLVFLNHEVSRSLAITRANELVTFLKRHSWSFMTWNPHAGMPDFPHGQQLRLDV